jgi:DNA-binding NarL/FixJ family response regulator
MGCLLLLPKLQGSWNKDREEKQGIKESVPSGHGDCSPIVLFDYLNEQDKQILERIRQGEKYESIAKGVDIPVITLKRRLKQLFKKLQVSNRESFLIRYGGVSSDSSLAEKTFQDVQESH